MSSGRAVVGVWSGWGDVGVVGGDRQLSDDDVLLSDAESDVVEVGGVGAVLVEGVNGALGVSV